MLFLLGLRGIPRGMTKTGKVTAKPAARTRFFLSIKRERKLAAPRRESLSGSTRRSRARIVQSGHGPRIALREHPLRIESGGTPRGWLTCSPAPSP